METAEEHKDGQHETCKHLSANEEKHGADGDAQPRRPRNAVEHLDSDVGDDRSGVKQQQNEVLMVPEADAIIHPRAMMIHPEDTYITDTAMVAPIWLELQAPFAMASLTRMLPLYETNF
jgi:hypothetical protein